MDSPSDYNSWDDPGWSDDLLDLFIAYLIAFVGGD
jgi:hypothetical protein